MEEVKKIKLNYPVTIKQEDGSMVTYSELSIGRLKNKHLKLLPKNFIDSGGRVTADKLAGVISVIANVPKEVAEEIDVDDTWRIIESLESFFGGVPEKDGKSMSG